RCLRSRFLLFGMIINLNYCGREIFTFLNRLFPKFKQVIVQGFPNTESGAIQVANYIAENYEMQVIFAISKYNNDDPKKLLDSRILILEKTSLKFRLKYLTSKFIFFTHGSPLSSFSKRQTAINLWHGLLYKKV